MRSNIVWSPKDYAESAVLAREVGDEMLSRLDFMTLQPRVLLDIGCGVGDMSARLKARYPDATILAFDQSLEMIQHANAHHPTLASSVSEAAQLPLRLQSVDLIFANFLLPWHADPHSLLCEWRRVLRPNGLLIFSALGPDTLKSWRPIFAEDEIPRLVDMHDIGDLLLQIGFAEPVLDVDYYTMTYKEKTQFFNELRASGLWYSNTISTHDLQDATYEATFEVVYAHAFTPVESEEITASHDGVTHIPLSQLRQRLIKK